MSVRVRVADRFNGPPDSGNGGYTTGLIALAIGEPVGVRLARPVPMNQDLVIASVGEGYWEARAGSEVIATAALQPVEVDVPRPPSWVEAFGVSQHFSGFTQHIYPTCFVCGPARAQGDGLRIFPGSVPGTQLFAAPWQPDASLGDATGKVRPEFVWASLDCPGYFASANPKPALLGELAVRVDQVPRVGEPCVVTSWRIEGEGRKHRVGTALFGADGQRCAVGVATWVELKSGS